MNKLLVPTQRNCRRSANIQCLKQYVTLYLSAGPRVQPHLQPAEAAYRMSEALHLTGSGPPLASPMMTSNECEGDKECVCVRESERARERQNRD